MNSHFVLYIIAAFLYSGGLFAQPSFVFLQILDSISNKPVNKASIYSKNSFHAFSRDNGYIEIPCIISSNDVVYITHPEYHTVISQITCKCGDTLVVYLSPLLYNLDEVVVTGTRTERPIKDVAVLTRVVTSEEVKKSGTTNIAEAITQIIPSLEFYNEGRGMTFRLQGIAAKYTLFLIDGERIAGENRENIDYYRLNTSSIDKIEIVKGASSSIYGSSAMGGVVNLITPVPRKSFESNIYSRFSKYKEIEIGGNIGIRINKITSFTDIVRKSTNGYDLTPATADLYTMEPHDIYSVYQKIIFETTPKLKITVRGSYYSRERFDVSAVPVHPFYTDYNGGASVSYNLNTKTSLTFNYFSDKYRTFDVLERRDNEKMLVYSDLQHTLRILAEHTLSNGRITERQDITEGFEFFSDKMYSERILDSVKNITNYTFLLQDELKVNNALSVIIGSRFDYHSIYGGHFSPKVSVMLKKNRLINRFTYGHGFRAPSIKERFYDFDLGFLFFKGNESLRPESSHYFSFSAEYYHRILMPSVNLYINIVRNMIQDVALANTENGFTYANFSLVNIAGIDYTQKIKLSDHIIINCGYSLTDAYDKVNHKALPGVSKHSGTAGFEISKTYKGYSVSVAVKGKIYSRKTYTTLDEKTYLFYDDTFPAYSIWTMAVNQQFYRQAISLTLGINNIFNYTNESDLINVDPGRRLYFNINVSPEKFFNKK